MRAQPSTTCPPAALTRGWRSARQRLADQAGFSLVEVMVSAALAALLAAGLFSGLESSSKTSADLRQHAVAQGLAQQDEDRLRGLRVSELSNLNQTQTLTVDGVPYSVQSTGDYLTDSTGTASCTAGSAAANYVETTSRVTWPNMGTRSPVVAQSLVTPPNGSINPNNGAVAVQVLDSRGIGVANMNASLSGTATASGATSSNGCVIFGDLPAGPYNATVSATGYVDKDGNSSPPVNQQAVSVIGQKTAIKGFQFDLAGTITYTFSTSVLGVPRASSATSVVAFNTNMTLPSFRLFPTPATPTVYKSTLIASPLFPFTSPYSVYAGSCAADAPRLNGQSSDPSVTVPQNGNASVLLSLPAIRLAVYSGTSILPGLPVSTPNVILTDTGCTPNVKTYPPSTGLGSLADPGQPYGTYTVCADNGTTHASLAGVANRDPVLGTPVNLYLGAGTAGKCT